MLPISKSLVRGAAMDLTLMSDILNKLVQKGTVKITIAEYAPEPEPQFICRR